MPFRLMLLIILISPLAVYSDTMDSLLALYRHPARRIVSSESSYGSAAGNIKCGFPLIASIRAVASQNPQARAKAAFLLERPSLPLTKVSPSGKFRVHYAIDGADAIGYSVDEFLAAADSAYLMEVGRMGFPAPVSDGTLGGDALYDIYIMKLSIYGDTTPDKDLIQGINYSSSYIRLHNTFDGNDFYTHGLSAAKVTIAHEFHHAIEMSNYGLKIADNAIQDKYFYEMTATSMEDFVFDYVDDYVNYLKWDNSVFNKPELPLSAHDRYDMAVWNLYLNAQFGIAQLVSQWQYFRAHRALESMDLALKEAGSSFTLAYNEFAYWCYYTGSRALSGKYFKDAKIYPMLKYKAGSNFKNSIVVDVVSIFPVTIVPMYYTYGSAAGDSILVLLVNTDIESALSNPSFYYNIPVTLSTYQTGGAEAIGNSFFIKLGNTENGTTKYRVFYNGSPIGQRYNFAFPNPLKLRDGKLAVVYFPLDLNENSTDAELKIFDASMKLVFSGKKNVVTNLVFWEPRSENNGYLGTGVYFYYIKTNQNTYSGKLAVVNE